MKPAKIAAVVVLAFAFGLLSTKACFYARAAEPEPAYNAVHLKKGERAPFDGDLVDPDDLIDLLIDAECDDEHLEIFTCGRKLTLLEEKHTQEVKLLDDARLACERRPPLTVEVIKPVPFYERPWFMLTVGVVVGGTAAAFAVMAAN
jgi:hypothetical protein